MAIWNIDIETMTTEKTTELQYKKLISLLEHLKNGVPFYQKILKNIDINKIKSIKEIDTLPFTVKNDLRDNYPYGMFAIPLSDVVRIHASSGTTGKPTVVGYSANDLSLWSELIARTATSAGVEKSDIAQIAYGYGLFTGGFGFHYGLEKIGTMIIPISGGNTARQVKLMRELGTTVLASTPSYALHILDVIKKEGLDPIKDFKLKYGLFGGEPWSEAMRTTLEKEFNIIATDNYGLSELIGPGVCGECQEKKGLHINEDSFLLEILDHNNQPLPDGEKGEVVVTTLDKEALPLLRYKTGDISSISREPCKCGRTTARLARVTHRTDDMLIIRGVNVYPSQIEEILVGREETSAHYSLLIERKNNLDTLTINVELNSDKLLENNSIIKQLKKEINKDLQKIASITATINFVSHDSITRSEGKANRVTDKR